MIDLYIDEDAMDGDTIKGLRLRGFDVLTASEARTQGFEDHQQLSFATEVNRVLMTFNKVDFQSIHTEWVSVGQLHAGLVIGRQQQFAVGEFVRRFVLMDRSIRRGD